MGSSRVARGATPHGYHPVSCKRKFSKHVQGDHSRCSQHQHISSVLVGGAFSKMQCFFLCQQEVGNKTNGHPVNGLSFSEMELIDIRVWFVVALIFRHTLALALKSKLCQLKSSSFFLQGGPPPTDLAELVSLVSAQQSTLYSQQAEIKQVRDRRVAKNESVPAKWHFMFTAKNETSYKRHRHEMTS